MKSNLNKILVVLIATTFLISCTKDDLIEPQPPISEIKSQLKIDEVSGIKLETPFVTSEVSMNVKTSSAGKVIIKILDLTNKVISKEEVSVKEGDNILKVYTSALPSSAYRIALYDSNGVMIGITDFNKIN
jgi:hypothetical protein